MQNQYTTLETLATIVADTIHPTQYAVTTREMILHSNAGWEEIYSHLLSLAKEELVVISPGDRIQFCITEAGLERAGATVHSASASQANIRLFLSIHDQVSANAPVLQTT